MTDQFLWFQVQMNSYSKQLEYTLLKLDCHSWWISKMQSDTLEERYAIKFCFKLGKNTTETYGMLQTALRPSCMSRASVFEWHKRFKETRGSVRDDERCGRSELGLGLLCWGFKGVQEEIPSEEARPLQIGLVAFPPGQCTSPQLHPCQTNFTKMDTKTVRHSPYSTDLAHCDFWLFPKLRGCRYETIEEMKEAVTKVIDTLTQKDFHGAFHKLLERYNTCIATGGDYFEGEYSFMCVLSIKRHIRKMSGNLLNDPRILFCTYSRIPTEWKKKQSIRSVNKKRITYTDIWENHSMKKGMLVGIEKLFFSFWILLYQ